MRVTLTLGASPDNSFLDYLIANDVRDFSFDVIICAFGVDLVNIIR